MTVMRDRDLLEAYVKSVLDEASFIRGKTAPQPKKKHGFFSKLKSFFSGYGDADDISGDWIEDQELYSDVEVPTALEAEIKKFVRSKWSRVIERSRGDTDKARRVINKALNSHFLPKIRNIARLEDEALD